MNRSKGRTRNGVVVAFFALVLMPALLECKKMPGGGPMPALGGPLGGGGACPQSFDDVARASWGLDAGLEGRVRASLGAALSLKQLSAKLEADVTAACSTLAKDLGASDADIAPKAEGPGKSAEAACQAASSAIANLKAKAKGKVDIKAKEPRCTASMDAMAECAGRCDAKVKPGSAKVTCEGGKISGACDAECKGTCTVEAGAACDGSCTGECKGACAAGFVGKCEGKCEGKCDGKNTKGQCAGTCDGKCSAGASGSCTGSCSGSCSASCEAQAKGKCEGSCTGECSVEMKAPKCTGEVKPPEMSADCKASCDAKVSGEVTCTPPAVEVVITGSADAAAATQLKNALSKGLPALLAITVGMKGSVEKATAAARTSIEGVSAVIKGGADTALKIGPCMAAAVEAQAQAAASINVSVKASASASASASGSAG